MGQRGDAGKTKSALWRELKAAGVRMPLPYVNYKIYELLEAVEVLRAQPGYEPPEDVGPPAPVPPPARRTPKPPAPSVSAADAWEVMTGDDSQKVPEPGPTAPDIPFQNESRDTYAAERIYQPDEGETPIRTDSEGRIWYREEVRKPATPQPRARRKITYIDSGVKQQQIIDGRYIETVEVAGDRTTTAEVKITMPSYQVGVYLDPRFPFKVHVYNDTRGFDFFDIEKFYGGTDLVPADILRMYVGNDLCYDMRSVIRSIQEEDRQQQLFGQRNYERAAQ